MCSEDAVSRTFHALVEIAERKFARVRDLPLHPYGGNGLHNGVFKAYMRLWKYQQENRVKLVESGLRRWEIGEISSRIGQLYFSQYMRTSEARFLYEAYIFYEAILNRRYFEGSSRDRGVRFKELRFYARFLMVSLILNHREMVNLLFEKFALLVEDSKANFRGTNFKEWKLVLQEIVQFTRADTAAPNLKPLRYCAMFDSYPASLPYVARFHAKRLLKFQDAVLTSYHKNEVKFAELTLDTFRMLQCLEWEPSGSFYQKHPVESRNNGNLSDHSVASGLIDINLVADLVDPTLPSNPKKAVLYRPSVTQLLSVIASACEGLPPDSVMLIYLSAPSQHTKSDFLTDHHHEQSNGPCQNGVTVNGESSQYFENYLSLGPTRNGGPNFLYPGDIIPFTRRPAFLIIDSDNSHAFKVLHGAERGETAAIFLSPRRPSYKDPNGIDLIQNGSQFTFFLTVPLQAFCQLVGFNLSNDDLDLYNDLDDIICTAFSNWEKILCTSTSVDLVWAQLLSDPFLRRLILRFIFCRAALTLFCLRESGDGYLPVCIPELPSVLSPESEALQSSISQLADRLEVADCFSFQ